MKTLLSLLAASAIAVSATSAFAMCGHQSVKLQQTIASSTNQTEQEAMTTHEDETVKRKVTEEKAD